MNDSNLLPGPPYRNGKAHSGELIPRQYFEAPQGNQPTQDEPDALITYWRILQRHKAALILAIVLGGIAGTLWTIPQTPLYQSTVTIEIQGINEDFLNMRSINPTLSNSYDPTIEIQTQIREMQSQAVTDRVINKMRTIDPAELMMGKDRLALWRGALHLGNPNPPSIEQALGATSVRIKPSLSSRIVDITCDSVNPKVAAQFANTLAEEYIQQNLESRWKATQKTGEFLTRQIEELKIKLERSEDELQTYMNNAGLMFITGEKEKENVAEEKLRQLQGEVLKAGSERVAKQSQFELIKTVPIESLPEVLDDKTLAEYQGKLTDLRRQMSELDVTLTESHPKVQKLQAQINTLEAELKRTRTNIQDRVTNEYQAAQNRERLLTAQFDVQKGIVSDQAAKVVHYNILKREVDTNRQVYEAMLQRVKESGIVSAMKASGIRVVDPAVPSSIPYKPNLSRGAMLGCIAGFCMGAVFVFLRERANRNLEQPGDSAFYLNIPELGVIPTSNSDPGKGEQGASVVRTNDSIRPEMDPVELVTWNRKFSLLAEAFRTTLTSLLFSGHNGDQPRLIVLTSANPSEGKTTVTINLAISLAEINRRVLLIDADMRRPRLQNLFDLGAGPGLADLLREKTADEHISTDQAICPTAIPGLFVMRSGRSSGVVSNLLHSARLPELLQQLRNEWDNVVIDTPPALHISDARVIGRLADAVLLIIRAGQTTRDAAQMVKQRFGEDGTPLLGTILNGWNPKRDVYGYKYRYYNGNVAAYSQKESVSEREGE